VGISDHSEHINEMDQLLEKITSANDKLTTLEKHFKVCIVAFDKKFDI
jgi:hypothetical protein